MPYTVSSSFLSRARSYAPTGLQRQFLIGTSDYTDRVIKWPRLRTVAMDPRPKNVVINLMNEDGVFNFFKDTPTTMQRICSVSIGFSGEFIELMRGTITKADYSRGRVDLRLTDKLDQLQRRVIGSTAIPVTVTSATANPAEVIRLACVSYGGYSTLTNSSNPDIDWESYVEWRNVFSASGAYVNANFTGLTVLELLRKAARLTGSAIFLRNDKLYFKRFSVADSNTLEMTPAILTAPARVAVDINDTVNRFHTFGAYNVASRSWALNAISADSASVNSYGLREEIERDTSIWYVSSASALDLSQREILIRKNPIKKLSASTALPAVINFVGEMITVSEAGAGMQGDTFRLTELDIDMENFGIGVTGDESLGGVSGFQLNVTSLNSPVELLI